MDLIKLRFSLADYKLVVNKLELNWFIVSCKFWLGYCKNNLIVDLVLENNSIEEQKSSLAGLIPNIPKYDPPGRDSNPHLLNEGPTIFGYAY